MAAERSTRDVNAACCFFRRYLGPNALWCWSERYRAGPGTSARVPMPSYGIRSTGSPKNGTARPLRFIVVDVLSKSHGRRYALTLRVNWFCGCKNESLRSRTSLLAKPFMYPRREKLGLCTRMVVLCSAEKYRPGGGTGLL